MLKKQIHLTLIFSIRSSLIFLCLHIPPILCLNRHWKKSVSSKHTVLCFVKHVLHSQNHSRPKLHLLHSVRQRLSTKYIDNHRFHNPRFFSSLGNPKSITSSFFLDAINLLSPSKCSILKSLVQDSDAAYCFIACTEYRFSPVHFLHGTNEINPLNTLTVILAQSSQPKQSGIAISPNTSFSKVIWYNYMHEVHYPFPMDYIQANDNLYSQKHPTKDPKQPTSWDHSPTPTFQRIINLNKWRNLIEVVYHRAAIYQNII